MAIYRGTGSTGTGGESDFAQLVADAEAAAAEAALSEDNAAESASDAEASAIAAAAAADGVADDAAAAAASASAAATSATNAANSATSASTSASSASTSASSASTSATNAANSATSAASSATSANTSKLAAATSETNAANSATAAGTSATNAATSATSAATSATTATTQATNASNSASAAATSATNASNSATSASTSATNAASSATSATNSATSASTSATNAASSATSSAASATAAALSESNAATSATNAANSASAASTSATNASNSASAASTSATNAATSETNAANSATAAAASYDNFDDRYLGSKATDPTLDNDGNALLTGALYWNSTSSVMKAYSGSAWVTAYAPSGAYALAGANTDITSMTGLTGGITTPDFVTFDTTPETAPTAAGSLYWDSADGNQTLALIMAGGDVTQQIGEEQYFRIKASSAITNGQVVMFTGTVGASGGLTGAPATGLTAATASYVMGIATQDIALNGWGYVTSFGLVRDLNTSAYTDGAILYLDPTVAGGLTATVPTAPAPKVQVCACVHAATNGSLFVRTTFGGTLGQYEGDVSITSPNTGDVLIRNSSGVWENKAQSNIAAGSASTATTATTATNQSGGTVAATTGSFSGNVTLSGGTANGVAYLNGSKAVTSGSALTFDGTNFILGANKVIVKNAVGDAQGLQIYQAASDVSSIFNYYNGALAFGVNNAEQMRLTSTGLGIGTSSPAVRLALGANTGNEAIRLNQSTNGYGIIYFANGASGANTYQGFIEYGAGTAGDVMRFGTAQNERMRIDSSGNLGLGVTPSAGWVASGSAFKALQVGISGFLGGRTANEIITVGSNAYYDGTNWRYLLGGNYSTLYQQASGSHQWSTATSGTAGNAISFTQAMTLDASGQLSTTTTGLNGFTSTTSNASGNYIKAVWGSGNIAIGSMGVLLGGVVADSAIVANGGTNLIFGQTNGERMRIDSAGNVGIGTSSPATKLDVVGNSKVTGMLYCQAPSTTATFLLYGGNTAVDGAFSFKSQATRALTINDDYAGVERMRIDSSGNLLVGTTSLIAGSEKVAFKFSSNTGPGLVLSDSTIQNGSTFAGFYASTTRIGAIVANGTTAVAYNTSSDYRLKENIQPMQNALDVVAQLNPVRYTWKADGSDGQGFIAHELQAVVPDCVTGEKDAVDEDGKPVYQGIDTSFLVATLTKAIQEQQELINQLTARVAQLEGN